jgi:flagellar M-ring protein FliF
MAPNAQVLRNRANSLMAGFSPGQRVVVVVAALALIIGGVVFTQWASKPTMVPLYSNLSSDDASQITGKLQSSHVSYTLADGGSTIMVPQSKVYQTRLDMAGAGLPSGGESGYTLLDKQGITTSDFLEHVDYQRALEGELDKTIQSMDGIETASVNLNIPQSDVFADENQKTTASVLLKTTGSQELSSTQVTSIVNLVAGAVQGLNPTDVSVTDSKGRALSVAGQGVGTGADSDAQSTTTAALEDDLNNKIEALLTPVVGAGKAVVQSNASLDWNKVQQTSEQYNPDNKPVTPSSQSTQTENYGSGASAAGATGCLGANVTVTTTACQANTSTGGTGSGSYSTSNVTQDNDVDKTVTQTENTPGSINRLSVAVLVDSSVPNVDTAKIQQLVTQAAGLQSSRGDTVTVSAMPFDTSAATEAAKQLKAADQAKKSAQTLGLIKTVATVLIIGAVLALLFFTTKKKAKNYTSTPISLAELDAAMPSLPSADDLMSSLEAPPDNSPEALERAKVDQEITNLIEKQPDEVASLLRNWLADRRS